MRPKIFFFDTTYGKDYVPPPGPPEVSFVLPRDIHDLDERLICFDNIVYEDPPQQYPSWLMDEGDVGLFVASAYLKGEFYARGASPDIAVRRVMAKCKAAAQRMGWNV